MERTLRLFNAIADLPMGVRFVIVGLGIVEQFTIHDVVYQWGTQNIIQTYLAVFYYLTWVVFLLVVAIGFYRDSKNPCRPKWPSFLRADVGGDSDV